MRDIKIVCFDNNMKEDAAILSDKLKCSLLFSDELLFPDELYLCYELGALCLKCGGLTFKGDFERLSNRLRPAIINTEILVKAAKIKNEKTNLTAIDATAGMGEDGLLLAAAGFNVKLYEYDPIIAALLKDCIRRALNNPMLKEIVMRMEVFEENSIEAMEKLKEKPDVIFLDPMFPKREKSAFIKKKFQLLQKLELPCQNEKELLEAALSVKPRKIVIKRPLKGPCLADKKPDYVISGKAVRYDCFTFAQ